MVERSHRRYPACARCCLARIVEMIPVARPLIGQEEKDLVWHVLQSGSLAQGARVREFEERFAEFVGVPHAVATSSGTTALHLALLALDIGPGDEVITTPFTFIASANSILYTGARPVFVDVDATSFNIDTALVEAAVTPRTRAIMPVDLYGNPADLPALREIAEKHRIALVEDACQAHGAAIEGRSAGSWGIGAFSFYPTKNMTSGEGGMLTLTDTGLADRVRLLREHGMRVRYHHDSVGYNFRMTDVHAAIGLAQLAKLPGYNDRRREIAARYSAAMTGVTTPVEAPGRHHVYHQYTLRVRDRDRFVERLTEAGVGSGIYYPIPVHRQRAYAELGYGEQSFPVAESLAAEVVSIPVHPGLDDADVARVIEAVNQAAAVGEHVLEHARVPV